MPRRWERSTRPEAAGQLDLAVVGCCFALVTTCAGYCLRYPRYKALMLVELIDHGVHPTGHRYNAASTEYSHLVLDNRKNLAPISRTQRFRTKIGTYSEQIQVTVSECSNKVNSCIMCRMPCQPVFAHPSNLQPFPAPMRSAGPGQKSAGASPHSLRQRARPRVMIGHHR